VIAAAIVLAATVAPASPPGAPRARFASGELVVRFRTGTEGARLATRPAVTHDPRGTLSPVTDRLSREIGCPLSARRALPGGEVLLTVGGPALAHRLLSAARRDRTLEDAALEEREVEAGAPERFPSVRAKLRHVAVDTSALASRLSERLDLPVRVRSGKGREVRVSVDADALMLRVLERLRENPEIESVEPTPVVDGPGG
jgi:hypothetical protein